MTSDPLSGNFITICGIKVHAVQIPEITAYMEKWIKDRQRGNYIVTTNANTIVAGEKNALVREAVNHGSLSIADGFSLVLFSRFYGKPLKKRAYGPDLMLAFLKLSEEKGYSNFFYGSTAATLEQLVKSLKKKFPHLKIAGCFSPAFTDSPQPEEKEVAAINNSGADVVWVGLGGVKQELWMYAHKDRLTVPVCVGVGAAFDFLSGVKPQAPVWMRESGLEWFFRLATEPKRLWRRYLVNNLLFVRYVIADLIKKS
ncbi:MAG: WecB/TagA/CpsF family glycosyltransferase [Candidatus Omnitrophica bacterium]|nr:WecB/TagA/CpsF family glycosyltransferase [Candidatus Omnitrophota bacterium]